MSKPKKSTCSSTSEPSERVDNSPVHKILLGDNLPLLKEIPTESVELIYIDPPFNTGRTQQRQRMTAIQSAKGTRRGFGGKTYHTQAISSPQYTDKFDNFMEFLEPRLAEAHRILTANGSLFFHIDWREAAHCRLLLEKVFRGSAHCINEIIWAYDFGARATGKWPTKHDNIYWFAKNPKNYILHHEEVDRISYMAPNLVGGQKAVAGKTPTDVWWQTIVPTNGHEKTNYPTQKPLAMIERIVKVHSNPGNTVMDFFAGSGTTGEAAAMHGRNFILMDENPEAIRTMKKRLKKWLIPSKQAYNQLVSIVANVKLSNTPLVNKYLNSPFKQIYNLHSGEKGRVAKELVKKLLAEYGFKVSPKKKGTTGYDMLVNNHKVAVKMSFLWKDDQYTFQQIRQYNYDFLICLGISPHAVHAWIIPRSKIDWKKIPKQHGGERGSNTWWFKFPPPNSPYDWMLPQDGNLQGAIKELKDLIS